LNKGLTSATFNWSGKMDVSIDLLMSSFRSGHGCQTALLKIIEDWKKALDDNKCVAAILMDLSKAFDCLPHNPSSSLR
jgi:hypothetical protein